MVIICPPNFVQRTDVICVFFDIYTIKRVLDLI